MTTDMKMGLAVAYSGGRDSTALLHATLVAAQGSELQVHALHVHHGLSANADAWLAHCEAQCERWSQAGLPVRFHCEHLRLLPARGQSVEAVARTARYLALARLARAAGVDVVLLAHHRRDQAETFLLQALRGAGVEGQAAMPRAVDRDGISWVRPWLAQPRMAIEAYLRCHTLRYIDDDSNSDTRFARNRLRLQVWPALEAAFPQAEARLADAALRAQQTAEAVALDALPMPPRLDIERWAAQPPARARLELRGWLKQQLSRAPAAALVERLCAELTQGRAPARWPIGAGDLRELRRYRGELRLEPMRAAATGAPPVTLNLRHAGRVRLPGWAGTLVAARVTHGGVAIERLQGLVLKARGGGEQFQLGPQRPPRALKKQYQALGIPVWQRGGPLLHDAAGALIWAPGLGLDARALAMPGEPQLALTWEPDAAAGAARAQ